MTDRLKVIHVTEDMPIGGQEKVIAALVSGLDPERFAAEVWCLVRGGAMAEMVRRSGVPVRILKLPSYRNPLNILRLALHLRRAAADIVHTHGSFAGTFGRVSAILSGRRRVVVHVHTTEPGLHRRHVWMEKVLAHFTQRVVCVSHSVRNFVTTAIGIPVGKTSVIHNGVTACAASDRSRHTSHDPDGDGVIVSIGALVENKGHRCLIEAFHRAVSIRPALKLMIAGDGPLRAELESRVAGSGLSARVEFTGCIADIHPILDRAEMFVLPTLHREGLGLALMEALQHGLPVVATCVGGIPEVIEHNRSGLMVAPGDPDALCAAIVKLADDRHLRRTLGAAGQAQYNTRFRAERMVAQVESLYASMCQAGKLAA